MCCMGDTVYVSLKNASDKHDAKIEVFLSKMQNDNINVSDYSIEMQLQEPGNFEARYKGTAFQHI